MASDRARRLAGRRPPRRRLDYVVAPGDRARAIGTLTAITGRQRVPPAWALGPDVRPRGQVPQRRRAATTRRRSSRTSRDIERYGAARQRLPDRGLGVPRRATSCATLIARLREPRDQAAALLPRLRRQGRRSAPTTPPCTTRRSRRATSPRRADGDAVHFASNFNGAAARRSTSPTRRRVAWWQGRIREALDLGADGFMQDFGEQIADRHALRRRLDRRDACTTATRSLFHRATREAIDRYEQRAPGARRSCSSRARATRARRARPPTRTRTSPATRRPTGRAPPASPRRRRTCSTARIGGAYGFAHRHRRLLRRRPVPADDEGAVHPLGRSGRRCRRCFRLHGSVRQRARTRRGATTPRRVAHLQRLSRAARARRAPLIQRLWREARRAPACRSTRPLWLAFPGDAAAAEQDQEWLLGPDVLVAPVVQEGADGREVYFPAGCWRSPESGATYTGPGVARVAAGLDELPYFFRCGRTPFAATAPGAARLPRRPVREPAPLRDPPQPPARQRPRVRRRQAREGPARPPPTGARRPARPAAADGPGPDRGSHRRGADTGLAAQVPHVSPRLRPGGTGGSPALSARKVAEGRAAGGHAARRADAG